MRLLALSLAATAAISIPAHASETIRASVTIDNPSYGSGAMGVAAYASAPATNVVATHGGSTAGSSYGSWELTQSGSSSQFWAWSPGRVDYSAGNSPVLDGTISVSADIDGVTHTVTGEVPTDAVIALPEFSFSFDAEGNLFATMGAVAGADFYNLWLWNSNKGRYDFSISNSSTPLSTVIAANLLTAGDNYGLYAMANNNFEAGPNINGLFRSYTGSFFIAPAAAVPEPSTWLMMLVGFSAMGLGLRRRDSDPSGDLVHA